MRPRLAPWLPALLPALALGALASGCDTRGAVGDDLAVQPVAPANGATSPLLASSGGARPVFRWSATPAAGRFELQIDDSCTSDTTCAFPSPEIDEKSVTEPTYTPVAALPARAASPDGVRYYWHVRACQSETCGGWSPTRYVVVGTTRGRGNYDLDGDGFEDAVVAAPTSNVRGMMAGSAYVYLGGAAPSPTPALVLDHDHAWEQFGHSVAMLGDVNGDGFGDYLVRSQGDQSTPNVAPSAHAYVYLGGPALRTTPDFVLDCPSVDYENGAAAGIGDVNGDGYDDFAIGGSTFDDQHHAMSPSRVEVHFGGPTLANAANLTLVGEPNTNGSGDFFGSSIAGVGDVNADGYPDFAVGAHGFGKVRLYFGGPAFDATPDVTLVANPERANVSLFGYAVAAAGDFNGDGVADVAVGGHGPNGSDATPGPHGMTFVYFGGPTMSETPDLWFAGKDEADWFGKVITSVGDIDGDGRDDLAVLTPGTETPPGGPPPAIGVRVDFFLGGSTTGATAAFSYAAGPQTHMRRGLAARDLDGDSRPDLLVGRYLTAEKRLGGVDVLLGAQGYRTLGLMWSGLAAGDDFGAVIGR